jgi:energy-coupling factor transport system ATP-binding protein
MSVVEVRGFGWSYEGAKDFALRDANLDIAEGDFTLIIGPNESGKTTLVSAIKGLIPHSFSGVMEGEVRVLGEPVEAKRAPALAKEIGFVFGDPEAQFTALTVEEEIVFGLENIGYPEESISDRIAWAADVTMIGDLLDKPPYDISGGQKQRVAIASVIAMEPRILILDEPTSMIDPLGKDLIVEICSELKRDHDMTVIVVEHNIEAFAPLADRVVVVNRGRIERHAPPRELFEDPSSLLERDIYPPQVTQLFGRLRRKGLFGSALPLSDEEGIAAGEDLLEGASR